MTVAYVAAGVGVLAFLHVIASSIRNQVTVFDHRSKVRALRLEYQARMAQRAAQAAARETIVVDEVSDAPAKAA